mgnify:CR=1 FL=1
MENNQLIHQYPALQKFNEAREQIQQLAEACKNIVITDNNTLEQGKNLAKNAKKIETLIEDKRKEITKPLLDEKKQIDDFAKSITADLNAAVKDLRAQILKYEQEQERARQEELRRLEAERCAREEELSRQMAEAHRIDPVVVQKFQELKSQQAVAVAESPKNSITKVWTFEIIDDNLIPREFLMPDEIKIKAAVRAGFREIPGVLIYQKDQLVIR